jgi:serine protease Do
VSFCATCGSPMDQAARFCARCGTPRTGAASGDDRARSSGFLPEPIGSDRNSGSRWVLPVVAALVVVALIGAGFVVYGHGSSSNHTASTASVSTHPSGTPTAAPSPSVTASTSPSAESFATLYSQDKTGVVKILASTCDGSGEGTGFVIGRRLIATVAHVVSGEVAMAIKAGHSTYSGKVIGIDDASDVALIRTSAPLESYVFHFASTRPEVGDQLAVIGYPLNGPLTFSAGSVSGLNRREDIEGQRRTGLLQTDAAINPGNSGGPLIDSNGQVEGLVDAKNTEAEGLGYAVSTSTATPLLQEWRSVPAPPASASCRGALGPQAGAPVSPSVPGGSATDAALAAILATYFDGINDGDYASAYYAETQRAHHGESLATFALSVSSSFDSDFTLPAVGPGSGGSYVVEVIFTSLQSASKGPGGDTCDIWDLNYQLLPSGGAYLINAATSATSGPAYQSCSG